jgi:outer membrane biosynthesis protein TonB
MKATSVYRMNHKSQAKELIFVSDMQEFTIGNDQAADMVIEDIRCHTLHALIRKEDELYRIISLNDRHGTFVNRERVEDAFLSEKSYFQIGNDFYQIEEKDKEFLESSEAKAALKNQIKIREKRKKASQRRTNTSHEKHLQVSLYWGNKLLDVRTFDRNRQITLGSGQEATFGINLLDSRYEGKDFGIGDYHKQKGVLKISVPPEASGMIWQKGRIRSIDQARHEASKLGNITDVLEFELRDQDQAHIELGELSLFTQFVKSSEKLPFFQFGRIDQTLKRVTLVTALIYLLIFGVFSITEVPPQKPSVKDLPDHLKKALVKAGIKKAEMEKKAAIGKIFDALEGGRARAESGKVTAKKAPKKQKIKPQKPKPTRKIAKEKPKKKLNLESFFAQKSPQKKVVDQKLTGKKRRGNAAAALAKGDYARGTEGLGPGGGGESVGIGSLKGLGQGGGMGAGDSGLSPSKGREIEVRELEDVIIKGGLDPEVIAAIIKRYLPQIRYCYEKELTNKPDLKGKVKVSFLITANGSVSSPKVSETTLRDAATESCMLEKILGWKFPKPKGGGTVRVNYPFLLMSNN